MKNYKTLLLTFCLCYLGVHAQTVNKGDFYITPNSLVVSKYPFENLEKGNFRNNGLLILEDNLINNGDFFDYKGTIPQGKTILKASKVQLLKGESITTFNDLQLANSTLDKAFVIENNIVVAGKVNFDMGIGEIDKDKGSFTFLNKAEAYSASDNSFLKGTVEKEGKQEFVFPVGDKGFYRPAGISAPENEKDLFSSEYIYDHKSFFESKSNISGVIDKLDAKEYWIIDRNSKTKSDIILTLSWDEKTTPKEILNNLEKSLRILRWDENMNIWVNEGGVVDIDNKTISTPTWVKNYGYFTLGTIKTDWILDGDIVIYNLVTPNGDGQNDYFLIENINRFPNNKVEIFNRWGTRVYETSNYDSRGNVFKGESQGRVTVSKGELLPTGTYYYVITYQYKDDKGSRMIKKSGYLHLETN